MYVRAAESGPDSESTGMHRRAADPPAPRLGARKGVFITPRLFYRAWVSSVNEARDPAGSTPGVSVVQSKRPVAWPSRYSVRCSELFFPFPVPLEDAIASRVDEISDRVLAKFECARQRLLTR